MKSVALCLLISINANAWDPESFKKPSDDELRRRLSPEEYKITQKAGTELPFKNPYFDKKDEGIYVDIVSGEPLFSSLDKYDSGTGWPSFSRTIRQGAVTTKIDLELGVPRTEVRSRYANSHLGHVFDDGPGPDGKRYCMNSSSLRFIPKSKLKASGYGEFSGLFR